MKPSEYICVICGWDIEDCQGKHGFMLNDLFSKKAYYLLFLWRFSISFIKEWRFYRIGDKLMKTIGWQIGCFQFLFWYD